MDEVGQERMQGGRWGVSSSNPNFALFCLSLQSLAKGLGRKQAGKEGSIRSVCPGAQQMT